MLKVPCASVAGAHLCSALGKLCVHRCGIKEDKQGPRLAGVHSLLGNRHRSRSLQCGASRGKYCNRRRQCCGADRRLAVRHGGAGPGLSCRWLLSGGSSIAS